MPYDDEDDDDISYSTSNAPENINDEDEDDECDSPSPPPSQDSGCDEDKFTALRRKNNPNDEPTGHFTGRCGICGSTDLWDDNLAYGCRCCGATWTGIAPKLVKDD